MRRVAVRLIRERPIYTELEKIREEALNNRRRVHPDYLVCGLIARELARKPGRMKIDKKEQEQILDNVIELWERRKFSDTEFRIRIGSDCLTLKAALELILQQTGNESYAFPRETWRNGIMMTPGAARRYIKLIALDKAERVLKRLGLDDDTLAECESLDERHKVADKPVPNVRRGPKAGETGYEKADCALFFEIKQRVANKRSARSVILEMANEKGKIAGNGTPESRADRVYRLWLKNKAR